MVRGGRGRKNVPYEYEFFCAQLFCFMLLLLSPPLFFVFFFVSSVLGFGSCFAAPVQRSHPVTTGHAGVFLFIN